jgi:hypothetical protein
MYCLRRGPLVFSIAPKERWEKREYTGESIDLSTTTTAKSERKFPYCDYEIFPESPWNYAFCDNVFELIEYPVSDIPFSTEKPPLKIRSKMVPIDWKLVNGVCEAYPEFKAAGSPLFCELIPYGCTNLRVTEMPKAP